MSEDTRTCRLCGQAKPIEQFTLGSVTKGKRSKSFTCKSCFQEQTRMRYHTNKTVRASQVIRSMEQSIKTRFPEAWSGSIAKEASKRLLSCRVCYYCKTPKSDGFVFSLDHYQPLSLGGMHSMDNLVPACEPCNRAKHGMPPEAFMRWIEGFMNRRDWLKAQ